MENTETVVPLDVGQLEAPDVPQPEPEPAPTIGPSKLSATAPAFEAPSPPAAARGRGRGRGRGGRGRPSNPFNLPQEAIGKPAAAPGDGQAETTHRRERGPKPAQYIDRPENVGGLKKEKLSEEALTARMEEMKIHNAKLLAAREAAIEDENEWAKTEAEARKMREQEEAERKEQEAARKHLQQSINEERARVAARKLDKMKSRAWDAEKIDSDWNDAKSGPRPEPSNGSFDDSRPPRSQSYRGNGAPRGRGRGRGGAQASSAPAPKKALDLADKADFPALATPEAEKSPTASPAAVPAADPTPAA